MRSAPAFQLAIRPLSVEHEDGVVVDALDQQAKALLACAKRRRFTLGGVGKMAVEHSRGQSEDEDQEGRAVIQSARRVWSDARRAVSVVHGRVRQLNTAPCIAA